MKLENWRKFGNIRAELLLLDLQVPWNPLGPVLCTLAVALTGGGDWVTVKGTGMYSCERKNRGDE